MKQALKALLTLFGALVIVFIVRAYSFTIYTAPVAVGHTLVPGDRVLVNKWVRAGFVRGDLLVFSPQDGPRAVGPESGGRTDGSHGWPLLRTRCELVGRVEALPGDTITWRGVRYRIPLRCCRRCGCPDCKLYLVDTGHGQLLVHRHQVVGKARRLFHLPF